MAEALSVTSPLVSVIVVTLNGRHHLEHLFPSLKEQTLPADQFEIILVDNGSGDDTIRWTARHYPDVRILDLKTNTGFARANNEGAKAARGSYIALINNDTRVEPNWLQAHLDTLERKDFPAGCSSGRLLNWAGDRVDFIRGILTFDGHAFQLHQGSRSGTLEEETQSSELPFPCGGNMMIRRNVFLENGGFDENFFAYLEDVDFGWRFSLAGGTILYQPGALAYHRGSATGLELGMFKRAFLFERNAYMVAVKNMEESILQALHPAILTAFMHRMDRVLTQVPTVHRDLMVDPYARNVKPAGTLRIRSDHARNHLRAYHWIMANLRKIHDARVEVQSRRTISDHTYLEKFPLHLVPTYPGDDLLFSSPFFNALLPSRPVLVRRSLSRILAL